MINSKRASLTFCLAPALFAACGGAIDLDSPRHVVIGGDAGASSNESSEAGSASQLPAGGTSGAAPGSSAGAGGKPAAEPSGASAGEAATPEDPANAKRAWLAFDAQPDGESRGVYWLSAVESSCLERISPEGQSAKQPAFSHDGKLLAYAGEDDDGVYQIFTWETGGGTVRQITNLPGGATYPVFMPGDSSVAFVTGDPEALREGLIEDSPDMGDVMLTSLKSLEAWLLEPRDATADYPYFAPAFATTDRLLVSNSYAISELRLVLTGAAPTVASKRILTSPGVPQEPAPSPDGFSVAYPDTCTDTLQLYRLDITAGSPRSCAPGSRDYLPDAGVRSPDWGKFGFIAAELNAQNAHGLRLFDEQDLSAGPMVATPPRPRNPSWGPEDFTRSCE
jgi:hypothetical protein